MLRYKYTTPQYEAPLNIEAIFGRILTSHIDLKIVHVKIVGITQQRWDNLEIQSSDIYTWGLYIPY